MVTKRERLQATLAGEKADRAPVALWRHFPVDDQKPDDLARAIGLFQRTYDFDFVKVTPASSFFLKDWGAQDSWRGSTEGTREYTERVIREPSDWRKLPPLDVERGHLGDQLRCVEMLVAELGSDVPCVQTIFNPLAQAKNLAGDKVLMEHLRWHAEDVMAGLETITGTTLKFVEAVRQRGADGIFYAIQHASFKLMDAESYARFGTAFDRRILESATGMWLNVLHLHGEDLMFALAATLPSHLVNWHDRTAGPGLKQGQKLSGRAVCGGLRGWETVLLGTPDEVVSEGQEAVRSLNGRRMVLGAGCVVPIHVPHANLMAARQAVECA